MNILHLIGGNWIRRPLTQRFPDREPPPAEYRGHVTNDAAACVACGICTQVCVSAAIELRPAESSCAWVYDPARCTFCGFCVQYCPVDALRQVSDRGAWAHSPHEQTDTTVIDYPPCAECGKPAMPYSENLVSTAYGERTEELRRRARLCEHCRRQVTAEVMRKTFSVMSDAGRSEGRSHGR
ncbi:4Fe-4S binding protein [Streptomyces cavernae]|uniref:4Fe-4S binding protein n=1 Tax=Streptomyces cavernae TaxID=2259034 RepID=UPI000FEB71DE|nr:4Fe-4S binding protein [Streptomyces cavernae]